MVRFVAGRCSASPFFLSLSIFCVGKRVVFLGDDTWTSVYPNEFAEKHAFPSLVVKDLHTVDNGIMKHLLPMIKGIFVSLSGILDLRIPGDAARWDVLIAHFLGVDHVGHAWGCDHPLMAPKLEQMEHVIRDVMAAIDEETLLLVMGDHGMTWDGDHGVRLLLLVSFSFVPFSHMSSSRELHLRSLPRHCSCTLSVRCCEGPLAISPPLPPSPFVFPKQNLND